ncbi:unnamed protein product [Polarella glacialis]|uniref:RNA helicase n=1 Tax=Polarella glacialis TaxID=89957 RepID=A0A813KRQ9_POLGL|nr:unnamed protein product [Polarella glacialis]
MSVKLRGQGRQPSPFQCSFRSVGRPGEMIMQKSWAIGQHLENELSRLSTARRWLSFARERAPFRVVRRTRVFLCTIPSSYKIEQLEEEFEEDFPGRLFMGICDEAAATAETYVPQLLKIQVENIVLLGDHKQLQPLVIASDHKEPEQKKVSRSLMERMVDAGYRTTMLTTQYRMPDCLCNIVSGLFYRSMLRTAPEKLRKEQRATLGASALSKRLRWLDVSSSPGESQVGTSFVSAQEAALIAHLLRSDPLLSTTRETIKVVCLYKPQAGLIQKVCGDTFGAQRRNVEFVTVDACQGTEAPHVVLSTVRSQPGRIGFASNPRRLNVAISRAKETLTVVGCSEALACDVNWRKVLDGFRTSSEGSVEPPKTMADFRAQGLEELWLRAQGSGRGTASGGEAASSAAEAVQGQGQRWFWQGQEWQGQRWQGQRHLPQLPGRPLPLWFPVPIFSQQLMVQMPQLFLHSNSRADGDATAFSQQLKVQQ